MIEHLIRNKKFRRFLIARCYPIAIDGSQKFVRDQLWDQESLQRKVRSKKDETNKPGQEQAPRASQAILRAHLGFFWGCSVG
jgi:hypothetical protein